MNGDLLLQQLGDVAREMDREEGQRLDPRWDRLSAGELSAEEERELRALAGTPGAAGEAYEAFRPLGEDFRADLLRAARETLKPVVPEQPKARILSFPPRRTAVFTAGLAAAAAILLAITLGLPKPDAVPAYAAVLEGGVRATRAEDEAPAFVPGSRFEILLRPSTTVEGPLALHAFLERSPGGELEPWDAPAEIAPSGAVLIRGTLGRELKASPGDWTLWLVIGRPASLPEAPDPRTSSEGPGWRALRVNLQVLSAPPIE